MKDKDASDAKAVARFLELGEVESAKALLSELVDRVPEDSGVQLLRAQVRRAEGAEAPELVDLLRPLLISGDGLRTRQLLEEVLLDWFAGEQLLEAAERLLVERDLDGATNLTERAIQVSPGNGKVQQRAKKVKRLIREAREASAG